MILTSEKSPYNSGRITFLLLFLTGMLRPQVSGESYPFSQGLFLVPLFVALGLVLLSQDLPPEVSRRSRHCLIAVWLLSVWTFLTLLWTPDPGQGVRESAALLLNVMAFTLVFFLVSSEAVPGKRWLYLTVFCAGPVALRAAYQRFFGFERLLELLGRMEAAGENVTSLRGIVADRRVFAGFLNPNALAGFLAILIPFLLDLVLTSPVRGRKYILAFFIAVLAFVLLLTASLGGILVTGILAMAVIMVRRGIKSRLFLASATVAAILVISAVIMRGPDMITGPESSITQRIGYLEAGMNMAAIHPLAGWGAGSAPGALMAFVGEGFRPVTDPHNFLVRAWISWGLPGVLILLLFLVNWAVAVSGALKDPGRSNMQTGSAGLFFGGCAFILHSLMDMDFFVPETAFFGWLIMGAALGTAFNHEENSESPKHNTLSWTRLLPGILLLAAVLPSLIFLQGEMTAFKADQVLREGDPRAAAGLFRSARKLLPFNGRFALDEGKAHEAAGNSTEVLHLFKTADSLMRASPYPPWEIGRIALQRGDLEESVLQMERALKRYPTSPRIRIDLAQAYLRLGDYDKAVELLQESRRYSRFDREAGRIAEEALTHLGQ